MHRLTAAVLLLVVFAISAIAATLEHGAVKTDSGLVYLSLKDGTGAQPKPTDTVKAHYRGKFADGREFASSYKHGQPVDFSLQRVIKCWTEGLIRMKVGGKARLVCPANLAYGSRGAGGVIPPNTTLTFEIELLDVVAKETSASAAVSETTKEGEFVEDISLNKAAAGEGRHSMVIVSTNMGVFKIELYDDKAPVTVKNFLAYVNSKFYDGTIFHRVIESFMIQGGGMTPDMKEKPTHPAIRLESRNGLSNMRGTVAMARTAEPNSATAQFFINVKDNAFIDQPNSRDGNGYAVFGKVVEGMDVVDKIREVPTTTRGMLRDVPAQSIIIKSIKEVK